jgi:membrane protein YqaA with SNARE-associated domain
MKPFWGDAKPDFYLDCVIFLFSFLPPPPNLMCAVCGALLRLSAGTKPTFIHVACLFRWMMVRVLFSTHANQFHLSYMLFEQALG